MKDAARLGHYGLVIMNERAESVGGKLTISSTPDAGTQVLLCLPLVAQEQAA